MPIAYSLQEDREAVSLPIWIESFVGLEWCQLRSSPVFYGVGVPRGNGDPVVIIPGFLGSDLYLREMYGWLKRIGYKPYYSNIGVAADCPGLLMNKLQATIQRAFQETGRKVHLIGHSLGGMLARSETVRDPHMIASVICLGSPFRGIRAHPQVIFANDIVKQRVEREHGGSVSKDCMTGYCQCDFTNGLRTLIPAGIPQTAVYTKTDGIVAWDVCLTGDSAVDVQVPGSHCGLAFNPAVYRIIAQRIKAATETVEQFAA